MVQLQRTETGKWKIETGNWKIETGYTDPLIVAISGLQFPPSLSV
jgi:hypothetical protein